MAVESRCYYDNCQRETTKDSHLCRYHLSADTARVNRMRREHKSEDERKLREDILRLERKYLLLEVNALRSTLERCKSYIQVCAKNDINGYGENACGLLEEIDDYITLAEES